ncbi:MAG: alpha/beta hydrolase [Thermoanaerobaculales bacterium]
MAEKLHPSGFNLIAFDARSHGSSDGDGTANMLKFSADLRAALDEAERRSADPGKLGVLGLSAGGAAAIHAAANDDHIRAVVTVGAFAHPGDLMRAEFRDKKTPSILVPAILRFVEHSIGARLADIAPERQIRRVTAPALLVHGEDDAVVPVDHGRRLAAAAGANVELLVLPGRGHSDCNRDPLFWPRVMDFFEKARVR